ncbi:polysaccharide deacetylase [Persicimonas caeni]|uniref:Polysaccharide deacetylase n=1 Tax=Persicimonas caeni TaxID=2292766 RepID=A0A4Y6PUE6_PERCE|nr:polysaccharide deacetylase family protein [Persicimonas caeni]QDG51637.1 polysaccharide deacetylase [Persicimonas caeni]QED32858.1 polysaccharide deacetylase family protein [Persicimonas caeni]
MSEPAANGASSPPRACLTVDLDSLRFYRDIHGLDRRRDGGPDAAYTVGVRRLLDFFADHHVPATLFVVGRDAEQPAHAELLAEAVSKGFELGNHSYSHFYDLPQRPLEIRERELALGEEAIEAAGGRRPVGYRAPGYNITEDLLQLVASRGYLYDSSVFPCPPYYFAKGAIMAWQRLRSRPSRSAMTPASNLLAPIGPYRPSRDKLWKPDERSRMPVEVPMCLVPGLRFPIIGTSLHLLGESGFNAVYPLLAGAYDEIFQLEFHAIDFMDADDVDSPELVAAQPDLRVPWEKKRALYTHVITRLREKYIFTTLEDAVRALA